MRLTHVQRLEQAIDQLRKAVDQGELVLGTEALVTNLLRADDELRQFRREARSKRLQKQRRNS